MRKRLPLEDFSLQGSQRRGALLLKLALLTNTENCALIRTNEFFGLYLDE